MKQRSVWTCKFSIIVTTSLLKQLTIEKFSGVKPVSVHLHQ
jgi:hypothetical protein